MFSTNDISIWFWIISFISVYVLALLVVTVITFLEKRGIMHYKCRLLGEKKSFFESWPFVRNGVLPDSTAPDEGDARVNPVRRDSRVSASPSA